jgi:hypothetical protein
MELSDAIRIITPLIRGQVLDPVEKAERLAQIVQHIYKAVMSLKEARAARPGENGDRRNVDKRWESSADLKSALTVKKSWITVMG